MDLHRLLGLLRQGWLILLLGAAVGMGLGGVQAELTAPKYSASSTLLFSLSSNEKGSVSVLAEGNTYMQALMPSYVKVITTPLVLQPVIDELGLDTTATRLAHSVAVEHQLASLIVEVNVIDKDPARAADIANAIADHTKQAAVTLSPKGDTDLGQILVTQVSRAVPPSSSFSPVPLADLLRGLLVGVILGGAAIVLWDAIFSAAINSRAAVARATRAPVLGLITLDPKSKLRPLPSYTQPLLPRSESIRFLQSNLVTLAPSGKLCVVVTSTVRGEGRTSTAANLTIAMSLSNTSHRVLLVDADLRSASLAALLDVETRYGLTSVLLREATLEDAVVEWEDGQPGSPRFSFLAAGHSVSEPSDLLASEAMSLLLQRVRELYDVVILDSAPLLNVADAAILATQTDGAVVVVNAQKTRHRQFAESLTRMRMAGARVLGVVLNRMTDVNRQYRDYKPPQHNVGGRAPIEVTLEPDATTVPPVALAVPAIRNDTGAAKDIPAGNNTPEGEDGPQGEDEPRGEDGARPDPAPPMNDSGPRPPANRFSTVPAILPANRNGQGQNGQNGDRTATDVQSGPYRSAEERSPARPAGSDALPTRPLQTVAGPGRTKVLPAPAASVPAPAPAKLDDKSTAPRPNADDAKPDDAKPDAEKPDNAKPDAEKPDDAQPDDAKPDAEKPDDAKPDDEVVAVDEDQTPPKPTPNSGQES